MATRTAPVINGTPQQLHVAVRLIDGTGDKRSIVLVCPVATTNVAIEAYVAALALVTNASIWSVQVTQVYIGAMLASNATDAVHPSVFDNVVALSKNASLVSQEAYIPAPVISMFVPDTDNIDATNTDFDAWRVATIAILGGTYYMQQVRYTERREKNQATAL